MFDYSDLHGRAALMFVCLWMQAGKLLAETRAAQRQLRQWVCRVVSALRSDGIDQ